MGIHAQIKVIGNNGQLSLGKEFAGKMVRIDHVSDDTGIIKSGDFIPDSEKWLYQGQNMSMLDKALEWAGKNKPQDNFDQLANDIENGINQN